jgi:hypothetical protein
MKPTAPIAKPRIDDKPLYAVFEAVLAAPAILVAHQMGLFTLLAKKPHTLEEVAEALNIAPRAANAMLAVCTAWKLLESRRGRLGLSAVSKQYLVRESPTYMGGAFDFLFIANHPLYSVENVKKAVLANKAQVYGGGDMWESHEAQAEQARSFTRAMHSYGMAAALAWPGVVDLSKSRMMLDIAGGSGVHCIGALKRWPKLRATVFDLAPVCEVAAETAQQYGLSDLIATCTGDMWNDPFPVADVHFYSQIFHDWPPEKCRWLAKKSFASLAPGGRIIVHEMLMNKAGTGPGLVASFNVAMLLWTEGQQFSMGELSDILREAGFTSIKGRPTFGYWGIVTGHKV